MRPQKNASSIRDRHSASQLDGSERTVGELRGLLAISLAGGSHTAAIQWKSESTEDSVPWYVLNKIGGSFQASISFTLTISWTTSIWTDYKYLGYILYGRAHAFPRRLKVAR